jgi:hypothetical protein
VFTRDSLLLAVIVSQLMIGGHVDVLSFSAKGLRAWIAELVPFCFGHLWILKSKSHWF